MAVIELVETRTAGSSVLREAERARGTKSAPRKAARGRTKEIAEDAKSESATAAAVAVEGYEPEDGLSAVGLADDDNADEDTEGEGSDEDADGVEAEGPADKS
jgi:large subunit ribosomal protein L17